MTGIVEGLLTLARADGGRGAHRPRRPSRWTPLVRSVTESLRPAADQRRISLHLALDPVVVSGDADRLADATSPATW
jgi:signal transduction histidine kinase